MKLLQLTLSTFAVVFSSNCNTQTNRQNTTKETPTSPTATGLPAPYATKSSVNFSRVIGWPENVVPGAAAGFKVTSYGTNYSHPRWIYQLPNGDVLVAETKKE